ncbi:MAG: hypothetical protein ACP5C3_04560 [Methanomicrobiales archaeon]
MNESEIEEFVKNFKGMTWDELDDILCVMTKEDMETAIRKIKARFG